MRRFHAYKHWSAWCAELFKWYNSRGVLEQIDAATIKSARTLNGFCNHFFTKRLDSERFFLPELGLEDGHYALSPFVLNRGTDAHRDLQE